VSAKLVVARKSPKDIGIRGLELRLDGTFLVNLSFGASIEHDLIPGEHTLLATNSLYSRKESFSVAEGQHIEFEVSNVVTGLGKWLMAIGGAIYRVELRRVP
jgi:hypothetical protein